MSVVAAEATFRRAEAGIATLRQTETHRDNRTLTATLGLQLYAETTLYETRTWSKIASTPLKSADSNAHGAKHALLEPSKQVIARVECAYENSRSEKDGSADVVFKATGTGRRQHAEAEERTHEINEK